MRFFKKLVLGGALAASALTAAAPASAQYYNGYRHHHDNDAGVAIGVGILGLAVGAAIASGSQRHYDRGYDYRSYSYNGYNGYNGYDGYNRYNGYNGYDRPYAYNYDTYRRSYRRCFTQRSFDDYSGTWVTVQRCN